MGLKITSEPATEPVTRAEAVLFMRYVGSLQNDVIDALITAARKDIENWTNRTMVTTTYEYYLEDLCAVMEIPTSTVISVSSITYTDTDGNTQTLSSSLYGTDNVDPINKVYLLPEQTFPEVQVQPNAVKITFTAGYGAASAVPETMKTAIKMRVAELYEHRESNSPAPRMPGEAYESLLNTVADYRF
jgi:uncharacterized phiE125 gp8 family phage protein